MGVPESENDNSKEDFYPFSSWEEVVIAIFYARNRIPRTEMDLLLRCLRDKSFDTRKLPASIADLLPSLRKLPVPALSTVVVDIEKRKKDKTVETVDSKQVFYLDMEATLKRAFADPVIRKTILTNAREGDIKAPSQFLDSQFAKDPTPVSKLVSVSFRAAGQLHTAMLGDFVRTESADGVLLITKIDAQADGTTNVSGELWKTKASVPRLRLAEQELLRTAETTAVASTSLRAVVKVLSKTDFDATAQPATTCFSQSELHRRNVRAFNLREHIQRLKEVLAIPIALKNGKFIWIKIYLDGEKTLLNTIFIVVL